MRRILKFFIIVLIAAMSIYIGIQLNDLGKPKYIFARGIDVVKNKIDTYINISKDLKINNKFSIEGNVDFELESEYYKNSNNPEDKKKYNLINNLNNMETNFKFQQNQPKNTGYIEINENIGSEKILNAKYYINESTKYYFVDGIVKDYINDGSCNYFENLNTNNTEKDNIDYIYNLVIDSVKNNLKEEYFTTKEEKDGVIAIFKLDNDTIKSILSDVLKDLKNDKKAKKLLDNIDKDILRTKIKDSTKYLEKDEYYKIYIYTTKILHKPTKYKVEYINKENIDTYTYEGDETKGNLYYSVNDRPKYDIKIEFKNDEIKAKIKNSSDEEIGEFKLEKNNYNTTINYTLEEDKEKIDLIYSSKYSNIKKNQSFTNKKNLSFKYVVDKQTKLSGEVESTIKVSNKFSIITDITNAKMKINMTEEEKEQMNNLYDRVKNRLER